MKKCKYFSIEEIVCPHIYKQYGEQAWMFVPTWMRETLDLLREHFNAPITVNNYKWGGNLTQRGIRCIECRLVKERLEEGRPYASTHYTFQALDINIKGWSAKDVYEEILKNQKKFKHIKRMENIAYTPTWTHIDNKDIGKPNIYIFNP